ncbi:MAG: response regulator [Actinomycetota bacterium]
MKVSMVVEDEPDMRDLIKMTLMEDPRFEIVVEAASAEDAIGLADTHEPGLVVLDHSLDGELTGLDAAPKIKAVAPECKIILFTADASLRSRADAEPSVDAFLVKTDLLKLLSLAQRFMGLGPIPT